MTHKPPNISRAGDRFATLACWLAAIIAATAAFLIGRTITFALGLSWHCQVLWLVLAFVVGVHVQRWVAARTVNKQSRSHSRSDKSSAGEQERRTKAGRILLALTTWLGVIFLPLGVLLNVGVLPPLPFRIAQSPEAWILVLGPMIILPSALLERCKPHWGAGLLMVSSILVGEFAIQTGMPGPGYDNWPAFVSITTITVPMMVLGFALLLTVKCPISRRLLIACLAIVSLSCAYFFLRYLSANC
jgi:hypothetical protein